MIGSPRSKGSTERASWLHFHMLGLLILPVKNAQPYQKYYIIGCVSFPFPLWRGIIQPSHCLCWHVCTANNHVNESRVSNKKYKYHILGNRSLFQLFWQKHSENKTREVKRRFVLCFPISNRRMLFTKRRKRDRPIHRLTSLITLALMNRDGILGVRVCENLLISSSTLPGLRSLSGTTSPNSRTFTPPFPSLLMNHTSLF